MNIKIDNIIDRLKKLEIECEANHDMAKEVSFRAGGKSDIFVVPKNIKELKATIDILKSNESPVFFMGNGSNFFVTDKGFRGAIIKFDHRYFGDIEIDEKECLVKVGCGALMKHIGQKTKEASLTGFEFASGIPGSLGGAIFMNAGAYDGEMKDIALDVTVLNIDTMTLEVVKNEHADFGYRSSIFQKKNCVIIGSTLQLKTGNIKDISDKMAELLFKRNSKQPIQYPSGGSFFKRPTGYFAGKLIEDCGLKGHFVGGAQVSEKHSGFIINKGKATASDIIELKNYCQREVFKKFGIELENEVRILGEE